MRTLSQPGLPGACLGRVRQRSGGQACRLSEYVQDLSLSGRSVAKLGDGVLHMPCTPPASA